MLRYLPAVLLVLAGFWLGRDVARGDPEVTTFDHVQANRITLRGESRAVVISPEGIWLETQDGQAAYVEADKFALSSMAGGQRRNLASLVGSASDGTAGLVFYGDGPAPRMVLQNTAQGAGFVVYNDRGGPRLALVGGRDRSRIHVFDADGKLLCHLGTEPREPTEDDKATETGATFALFDADGEILLRLPTSEAR